MTDSGSSECSGEQEREEDSCAVSMSLRSRGEEEEEGTLSDLDSDVEQYIASEKEVTMCTCVWCV